MVKVLVAVVFTVVAGVFVGGAVACAVGLICSSGGGGGGGGTKYVGDPCSSPPNACGQTNLGSVINNGDGTGSCSSAPPSDDSCPQPTIATDRGFYADPSTVRTGNQTTLYWSAANATACNISGDNGFTSSGAASGSASTGALTETTTFTLTCQNGTGPTASASIRVIVDPHYQEI